MNNKRRKTLSFVICAVLLLSSCTSQMERDAEKMAKKAYQLEQSAKKMENRSNLGGRRMTEQEYDQQAREYIEFANRLHEKYSKTPEMKEEFYKLVDRKLKEKKD